MFRICAIINLCILNGFSGGKIKMALRSCNKIDTNRYELEVEVNAEEFSKALINSYKKNIKKMNIPGFRKGKAPKAFAEKYYGEKVFFEDAINEIYPEALDNAIKEANLEFVRDKIDFDIINAEKDSGLIFKAAITVKPEVEIENYKNLHVELDSEDVTEKDLEKEMEELREKNARIISVEDRPAQNRDTVIVDFLGFLDGETFDGGEGEEISLRIGDKKFIPGFEEGIIGHNIDEEFEIKAIFPENYISKHLAGKEANFKIKLLDIKEHVLPEIDDEFVKDISEFDTLEEFKKDLKIKLKKKKERLNKNRIIGQIETQIAGLLNAEIPEAMINNKINERIKDFAHNLRHQGLELKEYMEYNKVTKKDLADNLRPESEKQVRIQLALEKIAQLENIACSEEILEQEYEKIAKSLKVSVKKAKEYLNSEDVSKDIKLKKTMDFLVENSKIEFLEK